MKIAGLVAAWFVVVSVVAVAGQTLVPVGDAEAAAGSSIDCDVATSRRASPAPTLESFQSTAPFRIVDTRVAFGGDGPVGQGCTLVVDMSDVGPDDVAAYALSVTAIADDVGFVTAFACADGRPATSSVNPRVGVPTPNLVVVAPDDDGKVCLFFLPGGELIVDVSGWWSAGPNRFRPIEPVRVEDTRLDLPIVPADNTIVIDVGGVAVPDDAVSVSINIAAVDTRATGHVVVYPCGKPFPDSSNVNFLANETRSVAAVVELGRGGPAEGTLCVTPSAPVHIVVDVTGYYSDTAGSGPDLVLEPVVDTRVVDTRRSDLPGTRFGAETRQRFSLASVLDRPEGAVGALLNVVVANADQATFITVFPCTDDVPFISSMNHDVTDTANLVVTALDDDAGFCVYSERGADVVVDLVGVYTGREGSLLNELTLREPVTGTLVPFDQEFTVDGADYTIPCDAARTLDLRLGRAPGATVKVNRIEVRPSPDGSNPDREVRIRTDGLLTVEVARGSQVDTYHVRCLPTDFPRLRVETPDGATEVAPGWYMTEVGWNDPDSGHYLAIFDERGVPLWFKQANQVLIDTKLLSTGDLVTSPITGTGFGVDADQGHLVVDLDGSVVAERVTGLPESPVDHHDYVEIPSTSGDRRAVISYPRLDGQDLTGLVLPATTGFGSCASSVVGANKTIVDGEIIEQGGSSGTWTWLMSDHFDVEDTTYAQCFRNFPTLNSGAGEVDPFHINSIDRVADPGCEPECDYVVSARHVDAVFRIDRSVDPELPGSIEWYIGADAVGGGADRLTVVGDPLGGPLRTHDARMQGDVLTLHDNRSNSGQPSRAVAYRIDPVATTATMLWQIEHPERLNNPSLGSVRLTDDATVLIGWGQVDPLFTEHALADGAELARWTRVDSTMTAYRIVKYPVDAFDAAELRAAAGGAIAGPVMKAGAVPSSDPLPM
jgi:hypothetical protein